MINFRDKVLVEDSFVSKEQTVCFCDYVKFLKIFLTKKVTPCREMRGKRKEFQYFYKLKLMDVTKVFD